MRARRRAIDLVGQDDVAEDRTARVDELAGLRIEDVAARDVAGQQIGRELNAAKGGRDALGQGLADQGLADARHVLEQHVVAGQQGHDAQPHDVGLAQHDLADVRFELGHEVLQLGRHARLPLDCAEAGFGSSRTAQALRRHPLAVHRLAPRTPPS